MQGSEVHAFGPLNVAWIAQPALGAPDGTSVGTLRNLDPYLIWALVTKVASLRACPDKRDAQPTVGVLVQFFRPGEAGFSSDLDLLPTHLHSVASPAQRTRWRSCVVNSAGLSTLIRGAATGKYAVEGFELSEVRLGLPDVELARTGAVPFRGKGSDLVVAELGQDSDLSAFFKRFLDPARNASVSAGRMRTHSRVASGAPLVCVIDDRCNFASESLRWSSKSVVTSIWLQGNDKRQLKHVDEANNVKETNSSTGRETTGPKFWTHPLHWQVRSLPIGYGIGSIVFGGALHGRIFETDVLMAPYSAGATASPAISEPKAYKTVAYLHPTYRWSHGSAILDLVAGHETWGTRRPGQWMEPRKQPRNTAPQRVCFVQLPSETVADTSGGSLGSHVLDGIHHALEEADPDQHVVVNVSYGTHSGPHDGTSLFERALNELLDFYDGSPSANGKILHVVLPAGNSHLLRCHAGGWLRGSGSTAKRRLLWNVLPDNALPSFIEIWLPFGKAVTITVTSPDGQTMAAEPSNDGRLLELLPDSASAAALPSAALIWPPSVPQGQRRTMALLAVQPSLVPTPEPPPIIGNIDKQQCPDVAGSELTAGSHGLWIIELEKSPEADPVCFDAWVQRADAAPGRGPQMRGHRGRQSYLLETKDCDAVACGHGDVDPRCTMNGIATLKHDRLYVIGAMRRSDGSISHYSAGGPNAGCDKRFDGPDWVVPADESFNNPGLLTTGVLSGSRQRVPGTSMAAAAFTRLLYEHLAKRPSADDLCGPAPDHCTRLPKVPCGAPQHADPMHRGECVRLMPTNVDGTLDFPCAAGSSPPSCKRPA